MHATPFTNLMEAINYKVNCPFCNSDLDLNKSEFNMSLIKNELRIYYALDDSEFIVNLDNNCIISGFPIDAGSYNKEISAIKVFCTECWHYQYTIAFTINRGNSKVEDIHLNSEFISQEIDGTLYEMRNSLTLDQTNFNIIRSNGKQEHFECKIIKIDLNNPSNSINRVRKLIPYI